MKVKAFNRIAVIFLAVCILITTLICGRGNLSVYAATDDSVQGIYESTNVWNNLKGATIGGKEFDIADYPHNENGRPQIISFVEFCYSYYADKQDDFGLYVYVYNPQDKAFDMSTDRNKIQLAYGNNANYSKYVLEFLNYSTEKGYEGRFYKFKVKLSDTQRSNILATVNENKRVYKISGIELSYKNTVTEYPCATTYTYSGYALGYGSELAQSDTLKCTADGIDKYLTLDVRSTYYRPKGTNGEAAYAQDTLHSVYFSIPNAIIDEYGEMTAVHATWLNAKTNPIFVTGNKNVYNAITPYIGKYVDGDNTTKWNNCKSPIEYAIIASKYIESASWNNASYGNSYMSYNANRQYTNSRTNLNYLYYCFLADNGNADNFTLAGETLVGNKADKKAGYFETYTKEHGGELINSKYSKELFAEVANGFTDITITKDDTFSLTDEVVSQSLWQKFVGGGYRVEGTNTYSVSAIKKVESSDFKSSESATCAGLYIDTSDYKEFKDYYNKATKNNETVYLFRYYQSDYTCYEAVEYKRTKGDWTIIQGYTFDYSYVDTNAYFMQMWVQLDFDIIDVTFTKNGVETVIPVIMSPMDIAADGTPPIITNGENKLKWWQILLLIVVVIIVIILLINFAPLIITLIVKLFVLLGRGVWWLICAPFRLIAKIVEKIKEKHG